MQDDLIDDTGFELGMPSHEEILKHQCELLSSDLELARRNLRSAHRELAGLIVMYRTATRELGVLKVENGKLRKTLSEIYLKQSREAIKEIGYAYGEHEEK